MADLNFDDLVPKQNDVSFDDLVPRQGYIPGMIDSFTQGASFGYGDELTALEAGLLGKTPEGDWFNYDQSFGERYDRALEAERAQQAAFAEQNPVSSVAGQVAGGLGTGLGAAKAGFTMMKGAQSLPQMMKAGAVEGAGYGALAGSGYGDEDRVGGALRGTLAGGFAGAALPPVISGLGAAGKQAAGLVGVGNEQRARQAVAEAVRRSGKSVDDIAADMNLAAAEGQGEYMLADALGNSGQRMLSGVVRSPGDARQRIAEALIRRQSGQSNRLINSLEEGFGATDTAAQRQAALTAARKAEAEVNYGLAREGAGTVDPTRAIQLADYFLQPGATKVMNPQSSIAPDSVEQAVARARGYLTDGNSVLSDFNSAFRSKIELDNMIEGASNTVKNKLIPIRNALDDALSQASPDYANARDAFRQRSQAIEAIETGQKAATRGRAGDNIAAFSQMPQEVQQAYRAGYADPLIAKVEKASLSPTTNKARGLISEKTGQEFPAFAVPGQADRMGRQIAREERMFQTSSAALGGSKTADNLADIADIQAFDPTMIGALATGNIKGAVLQALTKSGNALSGRNEATRDMIANILLETNSSKAVQEIARSVQKGEALSQAEKAVVRALAAQSGALASR